MDAITSRPSPPPRPILSAIEAAKPTRPCIVCERPATRFLGKREYHWCGNYVCRKIIEDTQP